MCLITLGLLGFGAIGGGAALLSGIGEAIGVTAGALGIAGSMMAADQQQAALDFEAEQAEANRKLYEQQALDIEEQGEWEKRNLALKQRNELASHQASAAASGVLLNYGSNLTLQEDAAQTNLLDRKQLQYDIDSRAYQARLGAWQAQNRINSLEAQKSNLQNSSNLNLFAGGVSTLGSAMSGAASGLSFAETIRKSGSWKSPTKTN